MPLECPAGAQGLSKFNLLEGEGGEQAWWILPPPTFAPRHVTTKRAERKHINITNSHPLRER